ncbi:MAG: hypothetical protein KDA83_04990 [Planctomycetales bacterium]|nr:hypothetical protein [Planctomycetales bacterium]
MTDRLDATHDSASPEPSRVSTPGNRTSRLGDLRSPNAMWFKGLTFVILGLLASGLLMTQGVTLTVVLLHWIAIWSFCRAYYFAFYVIEHYADPTFRYSGILDFVRYAMRRRKN